MDECYDTKHSRIVSITGIVVPSIKYASIRDEFYDALDWAIKPRESYLNLSPPELHGSKLFPEISGDDEKRFNAFNGVVNLVVKHRLQIFRAGYYLTNDLKKIFKGHQPLMLSLCWFAITTICQPLFETEMLIPVMDGFDPNTVRTLSAPVKTMDVMRVSGYENSLSIRNSENVGEVLYADSGYSVLTQVVDMISYLRHVTDWSREGIPLTPFKERLATISACLEPCIVREEIV